MEPIPWFQSSSAETSESCDHLFCPNLLILIRLMYLQTSLRISLLDRPHFLTLITCVPKCKSMTLSNLSHLSRKVLFTKRVMKVPKIKLRTGWWKLTAPKLWAKINFYLKMCWSVTLTKRAINTSLMKIFHFWIITV